MLDKSYFSGLTIPFGLNIPKGKIFISYHHKTDHSYYDNFSKLFLKGEKHGK